MDVLRHNVPEMEKATALFAFQGSEASSQISLAFNEEVSIKEKANEEWWWVINNSGKICIEGKPSVRHHDAALSIDIVFLF